MKSFKDFFYISHCSEEFFKQEFDFLKLSGINFLFLSRGPLRLSKRIHKKIIPCVAYR